MGVQDKTEKVLRSLHILLSRSESYPREPSKIIVDRDQMVRLLNELTNCINDMMGEYELTVESRNQAEREFQRQGDQIVLKANHRAEDVYAASVMYTDEALNSIQDIMDHTSETLNILFEEMGRRMREEKQKLRTNQLELRSQLQDLADTEKYMKIIEDRNREIEKEKRALEDQAYASVEKNIYADRSTGIKINKQYFEMMGIPLEEDLPEEEASRQQRFEEQREVQERMSSPISEGKSQSTVEPSGSLQSKDEQEGISQQTEAQQRGIIASAAHQSDKNATNGKQGKSKRRWGGFRREPQHHVEVQPRVESPFQVQDLNLDDEIADLGLVLDSPDVMTPDPELARRAAEVQVRVNTDAEYFRWKEQQGRESGNQEERKEQQGRESGNQEERKEQQERESGNQEERKEQQGRESGNQEERKEQQGRELDQEEKKKQQEKESKNQDEWREERLLFESISAKMEANLKQLEFESNGLGNDTDGEYLRQIPNASGIDLRDPSADKSEVLEKDAVTEQSKMGVEGASSQQPVSGIRTEEPSNQQPTSWMATDQPSSEQLTSEITAEQSSRKQPASGIAVEQSSRKQSASEVVNEESSVYLLNHAEQSIYNENALEMSAEGEPAEYAAEILESGLGRVQIESGPHIPKTGSGDNLLLSEEKKLSGEQFSEEEQLTGEQLSEEEQLTGEQLSEEEKLSGEQLSEEEKLSGEQLSEEERIDQAAKEADEELFAGIHALWKSMTDTIREEEEEN